MHWLIVLVTATDTSLGIILAEGLQSVSSLKKKKMEVAAGRVLGSWDMQADLLLKLQVVFKQGKLKEHLLVFECRTPQWSEGSWRVTEARLDHFISSSCALDAHCRVSGAGQGAERSWGCSCCSVCSSAEIQDTNAAQGCSPRNCLRLKSCLRRV